MRIKATLLKAFLLLLTIFCTGEVQAQITTNTAVDATDLVNKLTGGGVTVSGATLVCGPTQKATFVSGSTCMPIDSGVLLTTGLATGIGNPASTFNSGTTSTGGDPQLGALASGTTNDKCILEFDFTPQGDTIKFDYIFASEEYPEFACTSFNDVFAFFISGPGITGSPNIALLPGGTTPVTINNVNDKPCGAAYASYYVNSASCTDFVYDGRTTVLTAQHAVIPCQTYHLKLAIADVGDSGYDSGVFLRAGSLKSNSIVIHPVTLLTIGSDTGAVVRGCLPADFKFTISQPSDTPFVIPIEISGTATPGVDYVPLPSSVTIPAGDTVGHMLLTPLTVGTPTGPLTVVVDVYSPYVCDTSLLASATVTILDSLPVKILTPSDTFCFGGSRTIETQTIGGDTNMAYFWTPAIGVSDPFIKEPIITPPPGVTTYTLHAYYPGMPCDTSTDQVTFFASYLTVDAGPDLSACANDPINLMGTISPVQPGTEISWTPAATLADPTVVSPSANAFVTTTYTMNVTDIAGCTYADSMTLHVIGVSSSLDVIADKEVVCPGEAVNLTAILGGFQPCGLAFTSNPCGTAAPEFQYAGQAELTTRSSSPFFVNNASSGDRLQILYTKEELRELGVTPGYINAMAFNVAAKNSAPTDVFRNYTIRMGCTDTSTLRPGTFPTHGGLVTVFPGTNITTTTGWNSFNFPIPYYWDGNSNLVAEICWDKTPGTGSPSASADEFYVTGSGYNSVLWLGGAYTGPNPCLADEGANNKVSNLRPNTRFSICAPKEYNYTWTSSTGVSFDNPGAIATGTSGLQSTTTFTLTTAPVGNAECVSTGTVTVNVDNSTSVTITNNDPLILCEPGYTTLNAQATGVPFPTNLPCGTSGTVDCATPSVSTVGSEGGATSIGSPLAGSNRSSRTQFIITSEEMKRYGMQSATLRSLSMYVGATGSTEPYSNLTIRMGCTNKDAYSSNTDYASGLTEVFSIGSFTPTADDWNSFNFVTPYNWDTTRNLVVEICVQRTSTDPGGDDEIWVSGQDKYRSIRYVQAVGTGACTAAPNPASSGIFPSRPTVRFGYCVPEPQPLPYFWTPGTNLDDQTAQNPTVLVNQPVMHYTVSTYDKNGCTASDEITVIQPVHDYTISPVDTTICEDERLYLTVTGEGITEVKWYEGAVGNPATTLSCDDCMSPVASPQSETTYYVVTNDQYNCPETLSSHIKLYPNPVITVLNNDTTIKYGETVQLMVNGGVAYTWMPAGSLTDPRLPNPIASPVDPTTYVVVGVDEHGCKSMDSVRVNIDYKDPLLVPTAFTPNGDGRNDVFRVANLTFQKLIEFRVFNRWGQEVYSTTDNNGGWDGTWKGVPQDVGVYKYIIRVVFPDGTLTTYKGDVTLLR